MSYPNLLDLPSSKIRPMTPEETRIMFAVLMREMNQEEVPTELVSSFPYQVLSKRLSVFSPDLRVSPWVITFFAVNCANPAQLVMYAWMLHNWGIKHEFKIAIDTTILAEQIIPQGLPTEETLNECWDAQKLKNPTSFIDNALDYPNTWGLKSDAQEVSTTG